MGRLKQVKREKAKLEGGMLVENKDYLRSKEKEINKKELAEFKVGQKD